jgi:phosphatidylinositol alpha 1,6-mannosyltransferase
VALVSDCYLPDTGGIEVQAHDLARQLVAAGHEVVVLTTTPGPEEIDGVRIRRVPVPRWQQWLPVVPMKSPITPGVFRRVADLLAVERPDVVHFHGGILSPLAFKGAADAQMAGLPAVVTTHCLWSYATPMFAVLDRFTNWSRWPVVFSAVSEAAAAPVRRVAGPGVDVVVLPNGIDTAVWRPRAAGSTPSSADGAQRDDGDGSSAPAGGDGRRVVTLAAVMRLSPRKRPFQLLRMVRRVVDGAGSDTRVRLVLVGDGPLRRPTRWYAGRLGLADVVEFPGRLDRSEIRRLYDEVDVFVAPANLESFGIAALEARTAGVPVVAKAHTGVRSFVEHGREGLLATTDRDMAAQILRLVRDPGLRAVMAKHNAAAAPDMDWADVVAANVATYRRAVEMRSDSPLR